MFSIVCSSLFTHIYTCLLVFIYVYLFTYVYLCLLMFAFV